MPAMRYPIWSRFSAEARRAAATADYGPDRVTADGCCPLGVALLADEVLHPQDIVGTTWTAPEAYVVADAFALEPEDGRRDGGWYVRQDALEDEAQAFIAAWDGGEIAADALPALLEVA